MSCSAWTPPLVVTAHVILERVVFVMVVVHKLSSEGAVDWRGDVDDLSVVPVRRVLPSPHPHPWHVRGGGLVSLVLSGNQKDGLPGRRGAEGQGHSNVRFKVTVAEPGPASQRLLAETAAWAV